jgi:hypothetical protein
MSTLRHLTIGTVLSCLCARPLEAQAARSGFGMSFGLGWGSTGLTCEGCDFDTDDRVEGLAGYVRLGGYANPKFFIGVEGIGWMKNSDDLERRIAAVNFVTVGYPSASSGFFVRGGFGMLRAVVESGFFSVVGDGLTWQIGTGYDIPMGTGVAFTPYVTYLGSMEVAADLNEVSLGINLNPNILQVGLAITVR